MNNKRFFFSSPAYIDLSVTNACNLNCLYCYAEAGPNNNIYMPYETVKKLLDEIEESGVSYIRIAGGEPLVHPEINKILNLVGGAKMLSSMSTNAINIDSKMAKTIAQSGLDWVVVSLDGHNKEINNATRGGFNQTVRGVRYLLEEGVKTKLACVITQKNYLFISDIIEFAKKLGVDSIGFILFSQVGRAVENKISLSLNYNSLKYIVEFVNEYKKNSTNLSIKVNLVFPHESFIPWEISMFISEYDIKKYWIPNKRDSERFLGCQAGITTCSISADGSVYGCEQLMSFPEMAAGNIHERAFLSIWNEGQAFELLRAIDIDDITGGCSTCLNKGCGGGCRAIAYAQSHNILASCDSCKEIYKNNDREEFFCE